MRFPKFFDFFTFNNGKSENFAIVHFFVFLSLIFDLPTRNGSYWQGVCFIYNAVHAAVFGGKNKSATPDPVSAKFLCGVDRRILFPCQESACQY